MRKPQVVAADAAKEEFLTKFSSTRKAPNGGYIEVINLNTTNRLHYLAANHAWAIIGPSDEEITKNRFAIVASIIKDLWYGEVKRENVRRAEAIIDSLRKVRSEVLSGKLSANDAWDRAYNGRKSKTGNELVEALRAGKLSADERAELLKALLA